LFTLLQRPGGSFDALKDEAEEKEEIAEKEKSRRGLRMWRPLMVERKDLSFYLCPLVTILMPAKFCSLSSPLLWYQGSNFKIPLHVSFRYV
jgi:hypothetical protein